MSVESGRIVGRTVCVVLHDVAPATWHACELTLQAIQEVADVPVTLLAVPRYHNDPHDEDFDQWLVACARAGHEVALHGYTHLDDRRIDRWSDYPLRKVYTRGEGEFHVLPLADARWRLRCGMAWLERLGLPPAGFVAPAWLMNESIMPVLAALNFRYTCTLSRMVLLPESAEVRCLAQVYSNSRAWRRGLSVVWNAALARMQRRSPLMRLELHPHDGLHDSLKRSWQRLLTQALTDRSASTLADWAAREAQWLRALEQSLQLQRVERAPRGERAQQRPGHHVARVVQAKNDAR